MTRPVTTRRAKTQTVDQLMTAAFSLTHKMHALDKAKVGLPRGAEQRVEIDLEVGGLRKQRDIIVREIKRRAGEQ